MKNQKILFSYEDYKEIYKKENTFQAFVYRAIKKGTIKQIKRGLYALVDPSTGDIYANKFQIASHLYKDAYFSYHEALEYYGLGTQSFVSNFIYLSHTYSKDLEFEDIKYVGRKSRNNNFILNRMKEEGIRVVTLERALIDSIDNISLAGGLDEVEYALSNVKKIDFGEVEKILKEYNKSFLYQKVGYFFEKYYGLSVPDSLYTLCLSKVGEKVNYLENHRSKAKLNSKWKLIINKGDFSDELF